MNSSGKVEILDNKGIIITDQSLIRKVKATDSYKSIVKIWNINDKKDIEGIDEYSIDLKKLKSDNLSMQLTYKQI